MVIILLNHYMLLDSICLDYLLVSNGNIESFIKQKVKQKVIVTLNIGDGVCLLVQSEIFILFYNNFCYTRINILITLFSSGKPSPLSNKATSIPILFPC